MFPLVILFVLGASLCFGQEEVSERPDTVEPGLWERVVALYDEAKEQGEKVPGNVAEWIESDLGREGAWEYKVVDVAGGKGSILEKQLNELGAERWECIHVEPLPGATRLVFKRTTKSYLRRLPLSDLMRLIPLAGGSDEP